MSLSNLAWAYAALLALAAGAFLLLLSRIARAPPVLPPSEPRPAENAPSEAVPVATGPRSLEALVAEGSLAPESYLAQFVLDAAGERVGETVTLADGRLILKHGEKFFAVPARAVRLEEGTLRADEGIDWSVAEAEGEAWRAARHDALSYDAAGNPVART